MKLRGGKSLIVASAIITYAEKWLRDLVRDHSGTAAKLAASDDSDLRLQQRELLESLVEILPTEKAVLPINFLCCLLRSAIFVKASSTCKTELERRISAVPGARDRRRPPGPVVHLRRREALRSGEREEDYLRVRGEGEERRGLQRRRFQGALLGGDDQNREDCRRVSW